MFLSFAIYSDLSICSTYIYLYLSVFIQFSKYLSTYLFIHSLIYHKLKDRITPHVTNFFRLRLTIEEQEGKRKYKSDGAVMVGEFLCMYVCSCTVSE